MLCAVLGEGAIPAWEVLMEDQHQMLPPGVAIEVELVAMANMTGH